MSDSEYYLKNENPSPPLLSVVIPVYNVEKYIKEAIDSIVNQTIQDFEILIIDDGSSDSTVNVIKAINDHRVKLICKNQNKGLIDSLTIGFQNAKGKYIARMDGDDVSHKERFEKQLHILENNPAIKVCGSWLQEFDGGSAIIKHREHHDEIVARLLIGCSMSLGSVMLVTDWVRDFQFDATKIHVEDYDFWSKVAWTGKLYTIQEVLYFYRVHQTQVSSCYTSIQRKGDLAVKLFLFKKFNYDEAKFKDDFIKKMLLQDVVISVNDFKLFLQWLKVIEILNKKVLVFNPVELKLVLNEIKNQLIFKIYFQKSNLGITKVWRLQALFKMSLKDFFKIVLLKSNEKLKSWRSRKP